LDKITDLFGYFQKIRFVKTHKLLSWPKVT